MLIIIIMNIIKIFSDAWAMARLGPGPAPPLFTHINLCLHLFNCVYPCFTCVYLCLLMFTNVYPCFLVFTYV